MSHTLCSCQSGLSYENCCSAYHRGLAFAESAEKLMRSRYSAYTLANIDYIVATTVPAQQALLDRAAMQNWAENTQWQGLTVVLAQPCADKRHAKVEFNAFFKVGEAIEAHHENSLFVQIEGRWYFVDPTVPLPSNKQPCVCGSGKKFKHCCGTLL